jgi:hypothetical protein
VRSHAHEARLQFAALLLGGQHLAELAGAQLQLRQRRFEGMRAVGHFLLQLGIEPFHALALSNQLALSIF